MKDAGRRRKCPQCGGMFKETMPVATGKRVRWMPRPWCTRHSISAAQVKQHAARHFRRRP